MDFPSKFINGVFAHNLNGADKMVFITEPIQI